MDYKIASRNGSLHMHQNSKLLYEVEYLAILDFLLFVQLQQLINSVD